VLTVYPGGLSKPPQASNLNFQAHTAVANAVTVQLSAGGAVTIYNALGTVNVLADVEGYFTPASATLPAGDTIRSRRFGSATRAPARNPMRATTSMTGSRTRSARTPR